MRVAICGATGFVGSYLAPALHEAGHEVVAIDRGTHARRGLTTRSAGRIDITRDIDALTEALRGCDAVVNLVGIVNERGDQTFERVHEQGATNVVKAAKAAGVGHVVQLSVVGADADPYYAFTASKWAAEQIVRLGDVGHTVIRSGVLFGPGDAFFTRLTRMIRLSRVVAPVIGDGGTVFQPLAVEDLTRIIVMVVESGPRNAVVEVAGPDHSTVNDIVGMITQGVGIRRVAVHLPTKAVLPMAFLMSKIARNPAITPLQIRQLERHQATRRDSVQANFGFVPRRFVDSTRYLEQY